MPKWQRTFVISCSAVIGYCLLYMLSDFGHWPRLTYFPYERAWGWFESPPGTVPMAYLGTFLYGGVGALSGAALSWLGCRWRGRELSTRALRLWAGWALVAFVFAGLYFTWSLWPF